MRFDTMTKKFTVPKGKIKIGKKGQIKHNRKEVKVRALE